MIYIMPKIDKEPADVLPNALEYGFYINTDSNIICIHYFYTFVIMTVDTLVMVK